MIVQANSGTSKVAGYLIPSLQLLNQNERDYCQILILLPTRELTCGIGNICKNLSSYMSTQSKKITITRAIGGSTIRDKLSIYLYLS